MDRRSSAREAVEYLYAQFKDEIYRHALFTLGNPMDAEDVVSEVFIRVLRSWDTFQHGANPRTWIWKILHNYLTDVIRTKRRKGPTEVWDDQISLSEPFPDIAVAEQWRLRLLRLSPQQRRVVHLRFIEDLSVKDTAERLGWSQAKVRVICHRARQVLKDVIEREDRDDIHVLVRGEEHETRSQLF